MDSELLNRVAGGPDLLEWFGYAPRFHDAEVLGVALEREEATCSLRVHGFEATNEVGAGGFFVCSKHVTVTFIFRELTGLQLEGFNFQNAVTGISITQGLDAQFRMKIDPANGLSGIVEGRSLEIRMRPGIPTDSQYLQAGVALFGQSPAKPGSAR